MRRVITTLFILAVAILPTAAFAGQIWTDGDGDGLPDAAKFVGRLPSDLVTVQVWIDTQSYAFSYFQAWIERAPCLTFVSATYAITGTTNTIPVDNFTHPQRTGISGTGAVQPGRHGVVLIGSITFHIETIANCCVNPIIDLGNPPYSILGNNPQGTYQAFQSASGTCYDGPVVGTEDKSWGAIKGLYR